MLPSADTADGEVGSVAKPEASFPPGVWLTRMMATGPVGSIWATKTSAEPFRSDGTRLVAADVKAIMLPSPLIEGSSAGASAAWASATLLLTRAGVAAPLSQTCSL